MQVPQLNLTNSTGIALEDESIGSLNVKSGDTVFLNIAAAHLDESVYPEAKKVDLTRPDSQHLKGDSVLIWIGQDISMQVLNQVLSAIMSYENVRRGPGASGLLQRFVELLFSLSKSLSRAFQIRRFR